MKWEIRSRSLGLSVPRVMGILNVTPDSFSDGGLFLEPDAALERAMQIEGEGADLIDVGAESTRPGSVAISVEEEWSRLEPVLEKIVKKVKIPISVDTRRGEVARRALSAGADIINDISGGRDPELLEVVAKAGCGYVLMHMRGEPHDMMERAHYDNVVFEVHREMEASVSRARETGIPREKICIDPGFGFAKNPRENFKLFQGLESFRQWDYPLLVGVSRKRMLRELVGEDPDALKRASVISALWAVRQGAHIVRVHEVIETVEILRMHGVLTKNYSEPL
jgi:dihydropteroate synthase